MCLTLDPANRYFGPLFHFCVGTGKSGVLLSLDPLENVTTTNRPGWSRLCFPRIPGLAPEVGQPAWHTEPPEKDPEGSRRA